MNPEQTPFTHPEGCMCHNCLPAATMNQEPKIDSCIHGIPIRMDCYQCANSTPKEPSAEARAEAVSPALIADILNAGPYNRVKDYTMLERQLATALDANHAENERLNLRAEKAERLAGSYRQELGMDTVVELRQERDTLKQQLAGVKHQNGELLKGLDAYEQQVTGLEQQLASEREQKSELGIIIAALRSDLRDREQQLEQAVRLAVNLQIEAKNQAVREKLAQCEAGRVLWVAKEQAIERWLSSPAIAPIVARVKGQV